MKSLADFKQVVLYKHPVDMRKGRNGLCSLVVEDMNQSLFTDTLFIFLNRTKKIIRMVYWDRTGIAIWTKVLEKNRYLWPRNRFEDDSLLVSSDEIQMILKGIDISRLDAHKALEFSRHI